jgi:uncharacterized protein YkwD
MKAHNRIIFSILIIILAMAVLYFSSNYLNQILERFNSLLTIQQPISTPSIPKMPDGEKLFGLVNAYRLHNGLHSISRYEPLCQFAKLRGTQTGSDWSHNGYVTAIKNGKLHTMCPECGQTGENLAFAYTDEKDVLQAWIGSPEHKLNLDGAWDWGCAAVNANTTVFLFAAKR